jgi:lipoic acid synthetase
MVGLGETDDEVFEAMEALRAAGCSLLTVGQYLSPSSEHAPVVRYVHPEVFEQYRRRALTLGFKAVASGPLVRSSYKAGELLAECRSRGQSCATGNGAVK